MTSAVRACPQCQAGPDLFRKDDEGKTESNISSDPSFATTAGGRSSRIGTYVPNTGLIGLGRSGGRGFRGGSNSKQVTVERGRQKMQGLASLLRLSRNLVDAAVRLLSLAVDQNFIQGRSMEDVCGSCLYIACRREKSPHMLLDFAEAWEVLYEAYGGLVNCLDLTILIRFAHQLELNEDEHKVALSALKLVGRMKRDWLTVGRKPSGICAAALIIACRMHAPQHHLPLACSGFKRSLDQVRKVVGVASATVNKRLKEFEETPSAKLTVKEFLDSDISAGVAMNPPAFEKRKRIDEKNAAASPTSSKTKGLDKSDKLPGSIPDPTPSTPVGDISTVVKGYMDGDFNEYLETEDTDFGDVDDDELETLLLNEEETKQKAKIWHEQNDGHLREIEEKRELAKKLGKVPRKKRKKRKRTDFSSPYDAALSAVQDKNIAQKINLKALEDLCS
eukprot:jgi/Bigna1/129195/aug1.8_g3903